MSVARRFFAIRPINKELARVAFNRNRRMAVIWEPALAEEAARWQQIAARLTRELFGPLAGELDREQRYPWENVRRLVEHKLAGLFIPAAYGGQGASLTATAAVVEAIGTGCSSTAAILCVCQLGAF